MLQDELQRNRIGRLGRELHKKIRAGDGLLNRAAAEGRDLTDPEQRVLLEKTRAIDNDLEQLLRIKGGEAHEFSDTGDGEQQFLDRRSQLTAFPELGGPAAPAGGGWSPATGKSALLAKAAAWKPESGPSC